MFEDMIELPELPDSLLLHIFKYLNYEDLCLGVRMTCIRWWKITHDSTLWKCVDLPEQFTNKRLFLLLRQIQDHVEELDCSRCENLTDYGFLKLISLEFPKLKRLGMPIMPADPTSGDKLFSALATVCPNLEEIENIHPNIFDDVDPYKCQSLFKNLKVFHDRPVTTFGRLRQVAPKLDLEKRQKWRSGVTMVSSFCPNVEVYKCCRGQGYLDDSGVKYLSTMFPNLRKLELRQCSVTDAGMEKFFDNNEWGLTEIMFDQPGPITDITLTAIADHCPRLTFLKLSRCPKITRKGVKGLVNKCPFLTELHLNNAGGFSEKQLPNREEFDNATLKEIAEKCPKLNNFRLLYSKIIGHRGINHLVDSCRFLQGIMLFECPGVDDRALQAMQGFNYLKAMVLVNCNVSPKGVIDFILVAPCLQRLTLYTTSTSFLGNMDQLLEDTFCKLDCDDGEFRPNVLSRLTLRGVGGDFLQLITVLSPNLQSIDIRDAVAISVPAVNMVLRNCECLKVLDISSVPLLDDTFIASLLVNAACLRRLSLGSAVRHLDIEALANVISSHPSLTMVAMDTHDAAVDEENFLFTLKRSHNGKAFLHVDPESRKKDEPRTYRLVEYHCTPLKYLRSVTQAGNFYIPVEEFPYFTRQSEDDYDDFVFKPVVEDINDDNDDLNAESKAEEDDINNEKDDKVDIPPLEGEAPSARYNKVPQEPGPGSRSSGSTSEEEVNAAAEVSPQLSVWLGKKLKID